MTIACVAPVGAELGECPVWSAAEQKLYWVDIHGQRIHRHDPATGANEAVETPARPGSIALTDTPERLLVCMEVDAGYFDWATQSWEPFATLEEGGTGNRLNDGRTTPAGDMIVGSMFHRAQDRVFSGLLHRMRPDGSFDTIRRDIGVTNGQAFSPDGLTYYFADSLNNTVWVYDWDADAGLPTNERTFVEFGGDLPGSPDGACVDADGCYWVACVNGWAMARLTPGGAVDRIIELPFEKPTMPAFGGADLDTMYVTSISTGGSKPASPGQRDPGGLFALDVGVRGIPEPLFG